jgi:hypothetical protein
MIVNGIIALVERIINRNAVDSPEETTDLVIAAEE